MSRFEKLREIHIAGRRAEREYWESLAFAAQSLVSRFTEYLELPTETFEEQNGSLTPYVQLGTWDGREFERKPARNLPGEDGALEFAICVILDVSENAFPKHRYIVPVHVSKHAGDVTVVINPNASSRREVQIIGGDFVEAAGAVYDALTEALESPY